jgi:hypothetical protein
MPARRRVLLAVLLALTAAGCGSSSTAPQTGCQLVGGKVQVVVVYTRDRSKTVSGFGLATPPTLALVDRGDPTVLTSTNPTFTRVDDFTWTLTIFVIPNSDPLSHSATVIDLALFDQANIASVYAVTGVTANGVQIRNDSALAIPIGHFGVDACGTVSI